MLQSLPITPSLRALADPFVPDASRCKPPVQDPERDADAMAPSAEGGVTHPPKAAAGLAPPDASHTEATLQRVNVPPCAVEQVAAGALSRAYRQAFSSDTDSSDDDLRMGKPFAAKTTLAVSQAFLLLEQDEETISRGDKAKRCGAVLDAMVRHHQVFTALAYFQQMQRSAVRVTAAMYRVLITALTRAGQIGDAYNVFAQGEAASAYFGAAFCERLLQTFVGEGMAQAGQRVKAYMVRSGYAVSRALDKRLAALPLFDPMGCASPDDSADSAPHLPEAVRRQL